MDTCMGNSHSYDDSLRKASELLRNKDYREAEALLSRLIRDIESDRGKEAPQLLNPLYLHAKSIRKQHPWNTFPPEERASLERALRLAVRRYGEDSPHTKEMRVTLADSLRAAGDPAAAIPHMAIALRISERVHGEGALLAHDLAGLAGMLFDDKRFAEALSVFMRAFSMAGDRGNELTDFLLLWGQNRCLVELGRYADAIPSLERALGWCQLKYGDRNRVTLELRELLTRARQGDEGNRDK